MRIAYLSLHWPRPTNSGVGKKMLQQMHIWQAEGHETCFFSHRHAYPRPEELLPGKSAVYRQYGGKLGLLRTEIARSAALHALLPQVEAFHPDLIYLRSAIYVYPLQRLFSLAPAVIEVNTNEDAQHRLLGRAYHAYFQLTNPILLRGARGFIAISNEFAADLARLGKPVRVIGNGFDFSEIQPLPAPNNPVPRLVFIGSPGNPWHAVEKLAGLARACPDIFIDVVGYDHLETGQPLPDNLILHGYLQKDAYLRILSTADAAIGSLGLHRIQVNEASPLKTRECLAYGLPLILPFTDTDLDDLEYDWLLKIPNREDNLSASIPAVHDFLYRMRGVRVDRSVLAPRLDARKKELERLAFFRMIKEQTA